MWYSVKNIDKIDSPALLLYKDRIIKNIELVKQVAGGRVEKLRPHVKTHKIKEVCTLMIDAGITKFKCATIAEAEMLAMAEAPDVLLAYQPTGPKVLRLLQLIEVYPKTHFSCLIDDEENARYVAYAAQQMGIQLDIYIDLNIGMNRTGILPEKAPKLIDKIKDLENLHIVGLHGYDGHIHDTDMNVRREKADLAFNKTVELYNKISPLFPEPLVMVMGGTPTFPIHIKRDNCECSPGTFVFWDWGYAKMLPDIPFQYAALVMTRVISIVDNTHICLDLGHKSVAAESPLPRVHFLNAPDAVPESQSEEHLVVKVSDSKLYSIGDVFYGVPVHICPTVALYDHAYIIQKSSEWNNCWKVIARDRRIHI